MSHKSTSERESQSAEWTAPEVVVFYEKCGKDVLFQADAAPKYGMGPECGLEITALAARNDWAPRGFVTDYRWNASMIRLYWPLWQLDRRIWHTPDKAGSGKYPVNEVAPEDIGKVYKAWK